MKNDNKIMEKYFPELDGRDAHEFPTMEQILNAFKEVRQDEREKIIKILKDKENKRISCDCGWKGREHDLNMSEDDYEFSCPKCNLEIEIEGCNPEVVLFIYRLLEYLEIRQKEMK